MPKFSKFLNVDVIGILNKIMRQNTGFYQTDFEVDKKFISQCVSGCKEDKVLLWLSRPMGTHCYREYDVFIRGSSAHNTWLFYDTQSKDRILAYAIELTGKDHGKILGNFYELDYSQHCKRVKQHAVSADKMRLYYKNGSREIHVEETFAYKPYKEYGDFLRSEIIPNNPNSLSHVLEHEKVQRERLEAGDFNEHLKFLRTGLIEAEAARLKQKLKIATISPDRKHYFAELSPVFVQLAGTKDISKLLKMLPSGTAISTIKGKQGLFAITTADC